MVQGAGGREEPFSPVTCPSGGSGAHLPVGGPHQGSNFLRSKDRGVQPWDPPSAVVMLQSWSHAWPSYSCVCGGGIHHHPEPSHSPLVQKTGLTGDYESF